LKQISDNEIYLLIKYIKSVLWRVAKRLSYTENTWCLKVDLIFRGRCSVVYYYNKSQRDALFLKFIFDKKFNIFRTVSLSETCRVSIKNKFWEQCISLVFIIIISCNNTKFCYSSLFPSQVSSFFLSVYVTHLADNTVFK